MVQLGQAMLQALRAIGRRAPRHGQKVLTSKRGPRNFYKGKGCISTGRHTSKGYQVMEEKLPKYIVPDLSDCNLLPYVSHDTPKIVAFAVPKQE